MNINLNLNDGAVMAVFFIALALGAWAIAWANKN
jgi:hypothetical protein